MVEAKAFLFAVPLLLILFSSNGSAALQQVSSCSMTPYGPNDYIQLTTSFTYSAPPLPFCFTLAGENVTVDLNGYTITDSSGFTDFLSDISGYNNISIIGGGTIKGMTGGALLQACGTNQNLTIRDTTLVGFGSILPSGGCITVDSVLIYKNTFKDASSSNPVALATVKNANVSYNTFWNVSNSGSGGVDISLRDGGPPDRGTCPYVHNNNFTRTGAMSTMGDFLSTTNTSCIQFYSNTLNDSNTDSSQDGVSFTDANDTVVKSNTFENASLTYLASVASLTNVADMLNNTVYDNTFDTKKAANTISVDGFDYNLTNNGVTANHTDSTVAVIMTVNDSIVDDMRVVGYAATGVRIGMAGVGPFFMSIGNNTFKELDVLVATTTGSNPIFVETHFLEDSRFFNLGSPALSALTPYQKPVRATELYLDNSVSNNFTESVFLYSGNYSINSTGTTGSYNNTFLNSTFTGTPVRSYDVKFASNLTLAWYVFLNATDDSNNAVSGASLNLTDVYGTTAISTCTTNSSGLCDTKYNVSQAWEYAGGWVKNYNLHTMMGSKSCFTYNETTFNVSGSTDTLTLTLAEGISVTDCTTLSQSCRYNLENDIYAANLNKNGAYCINVGINDVVFNCNSYNIAGNGTYGLAIFNNGYDNITIKNCGIFNVTSGVYFNNTANDSVIYNNTIRNVSRQGTVTNHGGVVLNTGGNGNVSYNYIENSTGSLSNGIYVSGSASTNNWIAHNYLFYNYYGIQVASASANTVFSNKVTNSTSYGIRTQTTTNNDNNFSYNTVNFSATFGIGISGSAGNTARGNTVYNGTGDGILASVNATIDFNTAYNHKTSGVGVDVSANGTNVSYNNVSYNTYGIDAHGASVTVFNNTAYYNVNSNIGINYPTSGTALYTNVTYNAVYEAVRGIYINSGAANRNVVAFNTGSNATTAGIDQTGESANQDYGVNVSYNNVTNSTGNSGGIHSDNQNATIALNRISFSRDGIFYDGTSSDGSGPNVYNNTIFNNTNGIRFDGAFAHIYDNTIDNHTRGAGFNITSTSINVSFERNTISNAYRGMHFVDLQNSTFVNNTVADVTVSSVHSTRSSGGSYNNYFLNSTFDKSKITFGTSGNNNLTLAWFARAYTTYCENGTVIADANVNISTKDGTILHNDTSDANGYTAERNITEWAGNATAGYGYNFTPHWFNNTFDGLTGSNSSVEITESKTVETCFNVPSSLDLALVDFLVNFANVSNQYTYDTSVGTGNASGATPFLLRSDSTTNVNVTLSATALFSTQSDNSSYYRFNVTNATGNTSISSNCITVNQNSWYDVAVSSPAWAVCNLGYAANNNYAKIDVQITVPTGEGAGSKTSATTFTGSQA